MNPYRAISIEIVHHCNASFVVLALHLCDIEYFTTYAKATFFGQSSFREKNNKGIVDFLVNKSYANRIVSIHK